MRDRRHKLNMTQMQLAHALGVSTGFIAQIEVGISEEPRWIKEGMKTLKPLPVKIKKGTRQLSFGQIDEELVNKVVALKGHKTYEEFLKELINAYTKKN